MSNNIDRFSRDVYYQGASRILRTLSLKLSARTECQTDDQEVESDTIGRIDLGEFNRNLMIIENY